MVEGVDYSYDRPTAAGLKAARKAFAVRYGGPGSAGKQLDAGELAALTAAGLSVVANAEGAADGLLGGAAAGASWARSADQHFRALGMPADRPIYLSVDFDVTASSWPLVADALRGAAGVIGADRVGVYGGRRAMVWARRDRVAAWFWQTYAWSAGVWEPGNHVEQYRNGVSLAGGTVDLCRALQADYGQWGQGEEAMTRDEFLALIRDPAVAAELRKLPWTYPVQPDRSALSVFGELAADVNALAARPPVDVEALAAALAPLVRSGVTVVELREVLASVRIVPGDGA